MKNNIQNEIFLANCFIHKTAKQSRESFLNQLDHINYIRVTPKETFSLLPNTEEEWVKISKFFYIVNKGDFGKECNRFGIYVPDLLFQWFTNNNLETIQKQILLYMAALYSMNDDFPDNVDNSIFKEIRSLIKKYYTKEGNLSFVDDYVTAYNEAAIDYCKYPMPYVRSLFCEDLTEINGITKNTYPNIFLRNAYFTNHDWNCFVLYNVTKIDLWKNYQNENGSKPPKKEWYAYTKVPEELRYMIHNDDLKRSESEQETWHKWRITFLQYPHSKSHIYSLFANEIKSNKNKFPKKPSPIVRVSEEDLEDYLFDNITTLNPSLRVIGRQKFIATGRLDIVAEDKSGYKVFIELKAKVLNNGDIDKLSGQVSRYFNFLKTELGNEKMFLVIPSTNKDKIKNLYHGLKHWIKISQVCIYQFDYSIYSKKYTFSKIGRNTEGFITSSI